MEAELEQLGLDSGLSRSLFQREFEIGRENEVVTGGQFGARLTDSDIPLKAIQLLKLSKTFMAMVKKLDQKYKDIWKNGKHDLALLKVYNDRTGVLDSGPFQNRRLLNMFIGFTSGNRFVPNVDPDSTGSYDAIYLERLPKGDLSGWVSNIAHEITHAFHFVTRGSSGPNMAKRVCSNLSEEADTRRSEVTVVREIMATPLGSRELAGFTPNPGPLTGPGIRRDDYADSGHTYLEHFVLSELRQESRSKEKLDDSDILAIRRLVSGISLTNRSLDHYFRNKRFLPSDEAILGKYKTKKSALLEFFLAVINEDWRRFNKQHSDKDPNFNQEKEKVLQRHAQAFFDKLSGGIKC